MPQRRRRRSNCSVTYDATIWAFRCCEDTFFTRHGFNECGKDLSNAKEQRHPKKQSALTNHRYFTIGISLLWGPRDVRALALQLPSDVIDTRLDTEMLVTFQLVCPLHDKNIPPYHPGKCRVKVNHIARYITFGCTCRSDRHSSPTRLREVVADFTCNLQASSRSSIHASPDFTLLRNDCLESIGGH